MRHGHNNRWDQETEVIVVGHGAAGAVAGIVAHDSGAAVTVLEKTAHAGGSSTLAGGGVKIATDVEGAINYLTATQGGRCSEELVKAMAQGMVEIPGFMEEMCKTDGARVNIVMAKESPLHMTYPFPGHESLGSLRVLDVPGFQGFPWIRGAGLAGQRLVKLLMDNVASRQIEVMLSTPVKELLQDGEGKIMGVRAEYDGRDIFIKARKAVILACGGFEFNERLKQESFEAHPVYSMGHLGNTGDGILMAQKVGAALWHMWHFHGSYGFKFAEYPMAFRNCLSGGRNPKRKIGWINVDKFGKRFMDEYQPAPQDTMHRALQLFDPDLPGFPRIPCYLIFGEEGRMLGPIARAMATEEGYIYEWSDDNGQEIEKGWITSAKSLRELAQKIGVEAGNLEETVKRWNELCDAGKDTDFSRPPGTMTPLEKSPYYAIAAWPICTNTQGGPVHNARQEVLDPYGHPIPRLYAVGELGSFYGHIYLLGGNLAECVVGGRLAGQRAAAEKPW